MTLNELRQFFDTYNEVVCRISEFSRLCTDITDSEEIVGFSECLDGDICVRVWNHDCGNDVYYFPLEYLSMTDDEIVECEKKKAGRRRKLAEEEERKEKKRLEQKELGEYERLKKKYEGGSK